MRSFASSIPTDNLIRLGVTPSSARCASDNFAWEVATGAHMMVSTPPRLSAGLIKLRFITFFNTPSACGGAKGGDIIRHYGIR